MNESIKPVIWLHGAVKSPPFSSAARRKVGLLLHELQQGRLLHLPVSRPMPSIGPHCHELRVPDGDKSWRVIYSIHSQAIFVADVFQKTTRETPQRVIDNCRQRFRRVEQAEWGAKHG
jgi:phage-related protein